jgi:hypothetical protein
VSVSGYRYYSPGLGRWLAVDPIGENAFIIHGFAALVSTSDTLPATLMTSSVMRRMLTNAFSTVRSSPPFLLYAFLGNNSSVSQDLLGLATVSGNCAPFLAADVATSINTSFAGTVAGIREPFKAAIISNWNNMAFTCHDNTDTKCKGIEDGEPFDVRGYTPSPPGVGVLRDGSYSASTSTGSGSFTVPFTRVWRTKAVLCCVQINRDGGLVQYPKTAVHEAAHCVGWGGLYVDDTDPAHNNVPPTETEHQQTYWGIP